ncbi:hypothetical protein HK097_004282 [Rhizophlyctis rosea]|uniref:Peroxisomal biogenesis factor 11 n=1 Tax=Rhizophlyctis rosea TaxID=64517 RepID=A0AAD5X6J1_9FUNG|nr:hypothetical protein HK097_004282 [Rhizophlyctis rosea]
MSTSSRSTPLPPFLPTLILRKILLTNDGRDKILKCTQYTLKLYLILHQFHSTLLSAIPQKYPTTSKTISQLSLTRKIIRLGAALNSYSELLDALQERAKAKGTPSQRQQLAVLSGLVGIANGLADDIVCYGKLGIAPPSLVKRATPLADQLWFFNIFLDVYELMQNIKDKQIALHRLSQMEREELEVDEKDVKAKKRKLVNDLYMANVSLGKLGADFVFCSVDVFGLKLAGWDEHVQTVAGLVSALLGTYKLWVKNS